MKVDGRLYDYFSHDGRFACMNRCGYKHCGRLMKNIIAAGQRPQAAIFYDCRRKLK